MDLVGPTGSSIFNTGVIDFSATGKTIFKLLICVGSDVLCCESACMCVTAECYRRRCLSDDLWSPGGCLYS